MTYSRCHKKNLIYSCSNKSLTKIVINSLQKPKKKQYWVSSPTKHPTTVRTTRHTYCALSSNKTLRSHERYKEVHYFMRLTTCTGSVGEYTLCTSGNEKLRSHKREKEDHYFTRLTTCTGSVGEPIRKRCSSQMLMVSIVLFDLFLFLGVVPWWW